MSGHSRWSQIKHQKEIADQKRGRVFSKLSCLITVAARRGSDPESNPELKNAIDRARAANLPKENIERAINKAGEKSLDSLEELALEAIGPLGLNLIITAITDNRNRTVSEIKKILGDFGAKMAQPGAVSWGFDYSGGEFTAKYPLALKGEEQKEKAEKLLETLNSHDDVQKVFSNYQSH